MTPSILVLVLSWPAAAELPPFARTDDRLRARYYKRLEGDGPVWPRWRRKWSPIRAWTFPEGMAQRVQVWAGRELSEERRYSFSGEPLTSVHFAEGEPAEVVVRSWAREEHYDASGWLESTLHRVRLRAPGQPEVGEDSTLTWDLPEGRLVAAVVSGPADVFSQAFLEDGLLETCGCLPEDRSTTWIDGRVGARYRVRLVGDDRLAEVWAVPEGDSVLLATWSPVEERDLALGRAVLALARWEDDG